MIFSDDGKDGYGCSPNGDHFNPVQLTPELTRLDMVSSALDWLENLDTSYQIRPDSAQMIYTHLAQEQQHNMTTYKNTSVDFDVSATVAFSNPTVPEVVVSGSNFSQSVQQQEAKSPDAADYVSQYKDPASDKEWKRERYAVPDEWKDARYWKKRSRNNMSAKKSREAKRAKDLLIATKIDELEKENAMLKMMLADLMVQQRHHHQQQQQQQHRLRH